MTKWFIILGLLLAASIGLNVYLLWPHSLERQTSIEALTQPPEVNQNKPLQIVDSNGSNATYQGTQVDFAPDEIVEAVDREQLLQQANSWLVERDYLKLGSFLQQYLKQHPQDMDFLLIEAKLKVETTLLSDAIAHYYDLLRNPMTAAQQHIIEQEIERLSQNTIEQLIRNYSWDILAEFTEPLLQFAPNNRHYLLALALAYAEQEQAGLMENVLAALEFNDPDAQRIRQIINTKLSDNNQPDTQDPSDPGNPEVPNRVIPLTQYGDQYVVAASLSTNSIDLLIDTGASVTAISRQFFNNLSNRYKINYLGRFSIGTAAGDIMAPMYQFSTLSINDLTVENLPVVVLPMQRISNADGLLGMNYLREFDFKIDQQQSVLLIK